MKEFAVMAVGCLIGITIMVFICKYKEQTMHDEKTLVEYGVGHYEMDEKTGQVYFHFNSGCRNKK